MLHLGHLRVTVLWCSFTAIPVPPAYDNEKPARVIQRVRSGVLTELDQAAFASSA